MNWISTTSDFVKLTSTWVHFPTNDIKCFPLTERAKTWSQPEPNSCLRWCVSRAFNAANKEVIFSVCTFSTLTWWRNSSLYSCPQQVLFISELVLIQKTLWDCHALCGACCYLFQEAALQSTASIQSGLWVTPDQRQKTRPLSPNQDSVLVCCFFLLTSAVNLKCLHLHSCLLSLWATVVRYFTSEAFMSMITIVTLFKGFYFTDDFQYVQTPHKSSYNNNIL